MPRILRLLTATAKYPRMYAQSVEAMLMRVTTLLEAAGVDFSIVEFYCKHGGREGNRYLLQVPENLTFDDWAKLMVDDAVSMIESQAFPEKSNEAS